MTFDDVLTQVLDLLQRQGRVSYGALKRRFNLDDDYLEDLKAELIDAQQVATDEQGRILVWRGKSAWLAGPQRAQEAERRQLTVLFCDLVDSTALSSQLDPEDLREVVRAYQHACATVIDHFEGHIAQYLGDGLLVYFGYPVAHEDDALRAVRAGLGMVEALGRLNVEAQPARDVRLAARVGVHTGLVVVGEMGGGAKREHLALGETPNLAARLQSVAPPNTVVLSGVTGRLVQASFTCKELGTHTFKGIASPLVVYQVVGERGRQSHFDHAGSGALTPLVGREQEVELLFTRWAQAKEGCGQVVFLSGEAGIGKSRLVQILKDHIANEPHLCWECCCSPYYRNSAFYPLIDLLQRELQWMSEDTPEVKLHKLEAALAPYPMALPEIVPWFASLLSLPLPDRYPLPALPPQKQKQKILEIMLKALLALAAKQSLLFIVEDLHWADPSTLELLGLLMERGPTAPLLTLFVFRPEYQPPWGSQAHVTSIALARLLHHQTDVMVARVAGGKELPAEVRRQIVARTDGVPLFVEELTKMVLESGMLRERAGAYELTGPLPALAIPTTLHDSLMARLDRLAAVKEVAQLGATLGRAFSYDLLQAVAPWDDVTLQQALTRLVEAELLYQQGVPPAAAYLFKHALIQEAAYQSLLRRRRQQMHQRIAQVLEAQFAETVQSQPELVAHHYTEAGLSAQALPYWQRAGERALQRSANIEAISHLTRGLEVLTAFSESPQRAQQELTMRITLGPALIAAKGYGAPEVADTYTRARELCQQVGETPQLFPALWGLWVFSFSRGELQAARQLGEQLFQLAQRRQAATLLMEAHQALGQTLFFQGEFAAAYAHAEQAVSLYDPQQHRTQAFLYGSFDPRIVCLSYVAWALWSLGYPDQALNRGHEALALGQDLAHPPSLAAVLHYAGFLHLFRREASAVQARAEALIRLTEEALPFWLALGTILRGWALAAQGHVAEGIAQMHQGLDARRTMGTEVGRPLHLAMLAEACGKSGRAGAGLTLVDEALVAMDHTHECWWEAELYRIKGELLWAGSTEDEAQAEACLQRALDVARQQQARSLELRAAMSLSRLWQHQGKQPSARQLLGEIYNWFTEGFETADLQDARALLAELSAHPRADRR
jgi:predicted ATPase/class 3 adenylate cyclase